MSDFSHLKKWEDADKKIKKAQESVEALRLHTKGYFAIIEEQKEAETRKITYQNKIQKAQFFQSELEKLKIHDDDKIFIILQFLNDSVNLRNILVDLTVYQCHQK